MGTAWWLSIAAGALVGSSYALARWVTQRMAHRADTRTAFLHVLIGGMVLRMLLTLALAALTLGAAPVCPKPFGATLLVFLVGATAGSALRASRRTPRSQHS